MKKKIFTTNANNAFDRNSNYQRNFRHPTFLLTFRNNLCQEFFQTRRNEKIRVALKANFCCLNSVTFSLEIDPSMYLVWKNRALTPLLTRAISFCDTMTKP